MREVTITAREAEQRLDKYLAKLLPDAPKSLLFKSLRKKNITLNGKKAEGNEKLAAGDVIRIFFAEDTITAFQASLGRTSPGGKTSRENTFKEFKEKSFREKSFKEKSFREKSSKEKSSKEKSSREISSKEKTPKAKTPGAGRTVDAGALDICYEDDQVLFLNKPCGLLSQKGKPGDNALTDLVADYVRKQVKETTFRPGISNRLDRNTSGLVLAAKTHPAVVALDRLIAGRAIKKEYLTVVRGVLDSPCHLTGYLVKDQKKNQVRISKDKPSSEEEASYIETAYLPLCDNGAETLLLVELITGKSHQIRAHLAGSGHPLAGDTKYGDADYNRIYRRNYGLDYQLLHSWRVTFPEQLPPALEKLKGKTFYAPLPEQFERILSGQKLSLPVDKESK